MRFIRRKNSADTTTAPEPEEDDTETAVDDIEAALKYKVVHLAKRRNQRRTLGKTCIILGLALLAISVWDGAQNPLGYSPFAITLAAYGAALLACALISLSTQVLDTEIQGAEDDLELLHIQKQQPAMRAYVAYRRHQLDLNRYYNQSLAHGKVIFLVGIGCILAGFTVIAATLYLLSKHLNVDTSSKILIGSVGTIGGILSNFIAALFLRMFTTISQSLTLQHDRLVTTNFLHFGNFLASKVQENTPLREETLSVMARSLANSVNHAATPSAEDDEDAVHPKFRQIRIKNR
ncbi:hypothetical protein ACFV23_42790 [Streptomyces sp. NPDC059627]